MRWYIGNRVALLFYSRSVEISVLLRLAQHFCGISNKNEYDVNAFMTGAKNESRTNGF